MKVDPSRLAWAAGILEGEGCFSLHYRKHKSGNIHPSFAIHCEMTDEDVIEYLQETFNVGTICYREGRERASGYIGKDSTIWSVQKQEHTLQVLRLIEPWLFSRRKEKVTEMIKLLEVKCKK
jgi:hypothetical protein